MAIELQFTADKKPGTITVRVEGEHNSAQEYVLPYGDVCTGSLMVKSSRVRMPIWPACNCSAKA